MVIKTESDVGSVVPFRETVKRTAQIRLINHCCCCSVTQLRNSQKSSPTPQFKGINCLVLCLLYSPQLYVTTGKTTASTIRMFVSRVMFLLFRTLSRFVVAFLPRSKHLLISWLQSPSAVILEPKKRKSVTTSTFPFLFAM